MVDQGLKANMVATLPVTSNVRDEPKRIKPSAVGRAIFGVLRHDLYADRISAKQAEQLASGEYRFDIHTGQAVFARPRGFCVNREDDRKQRMARNVAMIEQYENRYVEVTDDGFVVREM